MIDVNNSKVDGYAWRSGASGAYKIDLKTWEFKTLPAAKPIPAYDIASDPQNNLFGAGRTSTYVWRVDSKTGEFTYYDIPDKPRGVGGLGGGMRRGISDSKGRLWWGGFDGNFVGMLDPSWTRERKSSCTLCLSRGSFPTTLTTTNTATRGPAEFTRTASRACNSIPVNGCFTCCPSPRISETSTCSPLVMAACPGCGSVTRIKV